MLCYTSLVPKPTVTGALFSLKATPSLPLRVVVGKASVMLEIEALLLLHLSPSGWRWWCFKRGSWYLTLAHMTIDLSWRVRQSHDHLLLTHLCSTYRGLWGLVVVQWLYPSGRAPQAGCPGFDSRQLLAFALSSIVVCHKKKECSIVPTRISTWSLGAWLSLSVDPVYLSVCLSHR